MADSSPRATGTSADRSAAPDWAPQAEHANAASAAAVAAARPRGRDAAAPASGVEASPPHTPPEPHPLSLGQRVYLWLSAVFVTSIVMANIVGVKLFSIDTGLVLPGGGRFAVEHTVGMLVFPVTFLLTDLLNEYFGPRAARRVAYVGFAMAAMAFGVLAAARAMPTLEGIPGTASSAAFEEVFGSASLMYIASLLAFLVGSLLDIAVFSGFNRLTRGRLVWLRTTGSTVVSQVFDSLAVTFLFFWVFPVLAGKEHADLAFVLRTAATGYVLKFALALLLTPAIYAGRAVMGGVLGLAPAVRFDQAAATG